MAGMSKKILATTVRRNDPHVGTILLTVMETAKAPAGGYGVPSRPIPIVETDKAITTLTHIGDGI